MYLCCDQNTNESRFNSNSPAHSIWLTLPVDVVDLDVDAVTEDVAAVDLAVEAARMRRRSGTFARDSTVIWMKTKSDLAGFQLPSSAVS